MTILLSRAEHPSRPFPLIRFKAIYLFWKSRRNWWLLVWDEISNRHPQDCGNAGQEVGLNTLTPPFDVRDRRAGKPDGARELVLLDPRPFPGVPDPDAKNAIEFALTVHDFVKYSTAT